MANERLALQVYRLLNVVEKRQLVLADDAWPEHYGPEAKRLLAQIRQWRPEYPSIPFGDSLDAPEAIWAAEQRLFALLNIQELAAGCASCLAVDLKLDDDKLPYTLRRSAVCLDVHEYEGVTWKSCGARSRVIFPHAAYAVNPDEVQIWLMPKLADLFTPPGEPAWSWPRAQVVRVGWLSQENCYRLFWQNPDHLPPTEPRATS